jgi:hypothetical protein
VHCEHLDAERLEDVLLARVNVAQTDVHAGKVSVEERGGSVHVLGTQAGLQPDVEGRHVGAFEAEQEGDGAPVQVTRVGRQRRVDIGVRVDLGV